MYLASYFCFWQPFSHLACGQFSCLVPITVATIMVLPVLIYWLLLDAALGTAIVCAAVLLLATATMIVTSSAAVWSMAVC